MAEQLYRLKVIENDEELKAQFLKSLHRAKSNVGVHLMEQVWRHGINAIKTELRNIHPGFEINWESVKQTLLLSAEYGLSFDPRAKELYLEINPSIDRDKVLDFSLGLKYNGMKHRLVKACGVRMLTTEVVYVKDTFEWRGQWKEPLYIMSNEPSELYCCFGMVKLKTGEIMAYRLTDKELLELERNDIERATQVYNDPKASFYNSAYRKRMFEIATLRYLYSQLISMFEDTPSQSITDDLDAQQLLAETLEHELNQAKAAG